MKLALTFSAALLINILLFIVMVTMIASNHKKKWVLATDADVFSFVRQAPKREVIPRRPAKTPPKPEPAPAASAFSESPPNPAPPTSDLRALPSPVAALKLDVPLSGISIRSGPALPSVISGGQSRTGKFGGGLGNGFAQPSFIMADELTTIVRVEPLYPDELRFRRIEGEVLLEFTVTSEGAVDKAKVVESSPQGSFDRAAIRAIQGWRFQPPTNDDGQPIAARARQKFMFKLY